MEATACLIDTIEVRDRIYSCVCSHIRWLCPGGEHMGTWDSKVWFLLPRLAERCGNGRGMSPTRRAKPADRAFGLTCEFCLQRPVVTYRIMSRWASQTCCKVSPGPGTHDTFAAVSSVCGVPVLFDLVPVRLWAPYRGEPVFNSCHTRLAFCCQVFSMRCGRSATRASSLPCGRQD